MIGAVNSCFGLVEREVVFAQARVEVVKSSRYKVTVFRGKCQTYIVNDGCAYGFWVALAVFHQYVSKGDDKKERAEGVSLCYALFKGVADGIVDVEG